MLTPKAPIVEGHLGVIGVGGPLVSRRLDCNPFDWQPSGGSDRLITTVVTRMTGSHGFSFVLEVLMRGNNDEFYVVPDAILAAGEVRS